jgi:hypothetical protein
MYTSQHVPQLHPNGQGGSTAEIPTFRKKDIDISTFQSHLSQGIPIVINDVKIQGYWGPEYFMEQYGSDTVTIIDCESGASEVSTVAKFFSQFGIRVKIKKLKVCPL